MTPYPIFSLQDVDPRSNEHSYTNDPEIMQQALAAREAKRKYEENQNKRIASGMSVIGGGGISLIPHPAAKIVGGLLQLPDIIYDVKDVVNNPSSKTDWTHLGLDFGSQIRHIIPGNIDDIFFQIPGSIDDGYNAITGKDAINDTRRTLSGVVKNKRSIKDKRNNRK